MYKYGSLLLAMVIVSCAYLLQTHMLFSSDVAVLIHDANLLLAGGKYGRDFFEPNPPMGIYIYIPACLMVKYLGINTFLALRLYVFAVGLSSIALSLALLKKIITPADKFISCIMFCTLFMVYFFLPINEFGQREHLLLMLIMPFLLATVSRLENKPVTSWQAGISGLMAGTGFALKPYFLVTLVLIELKIIFRKFAWLKIESIIIATVLVIYLIAIFVFHPDYIKTLPLLRHFYWGAMNDNWLGLVLRPAVSICLLTVVAYGLFYQVDRYRALNITLWLALIGMIIAFVIPKEGWYYHVLPALSLALLILASCLGQLLAVRKALALTIFTSSVYTALLTLAIYGYNKNVISWQHVATNQKLVTFINSQAGEHSIYCLSTSGAQDCFPLTLMTHSTFAGRWPFLWWFSEVVKADAKLPQDLSQTELVAAKKFFVESLAADFNHYQPRWVLINAHHVNYNQIQFFDYFSGENSFRTALSHYQYVMNIDNFIILERKDKV